MNVNFLCYFFTVMLFMKYLIPWKENPKFFMFNAFDEIFHIQGKNFQELYV